MSTTRVALSTIPGVPVTAPALGLDAGDRCPVLAKFVEKLQDVMTVPVELTKALDQSQVCDEVRLVRAFCALDWMGRGQLIHWVDALKLTEGKDPAVDLRSLAPIKNIWGLELLHRRIIDMRSEYKPTIVRGELSAKDSLRESGLYAAHAAVTAVRWKASQVLVFDTLKTASMQLARAIKAETCSQTVVPQLQREAVELFWAMRSIT